MSAIEHDIYKIAASLAKIDHFAACETLGHDAVEMDVFVSSEVEYLLGRCRSSFGNLQQVINAFWNKVQLLDPVAQRTKKQQLPPKSFADVMAKLKDRDSGPAPYAFPADLLKYYDDVRVFFVAMRDVRGNVVHHAANTGPIFVVPGGLGIGKDNPLTKLAPEPPPDHHFNENVVALLPVLANIVFKTLYTCNEFGTAFSQLSRFPEPLIDLEYKVFLRTAHGPSITEAQEILRGKNPWRRKASAEDIATAAYFKWLARGQPGNATSANHDWLTAERELNSRA